MSVNNEEYDRFLAHLKCKNMRDNPLTDYQRACVDYLNAKTEAENVVYLENHPEIAAMLKIVYRKAITSGTRYPVNLATNYLTQPLEEIEIDVKNFLNVPKLERRTKGSKEKEFAHRKLVTDIINIKKEFYERWTDNKQSSTTCSGTTKSSSFLSVVTSETTQETVEPSPIPSPTTSEIFYQMIVQCMDKATFLNVHHYMLLYDTAYVEVMNAVDEAMDITVVEIKNDIRALYNLAFKDCCLIIQARADEVAKRNWENRTRKKNKRTERLLDNFKGYKESSPRCSELSFHESNIVPPPPPCKCCPHAHYNRYPKDRFGIYLPRKEIYLDESITASPIVSILDLPIHDVIKLRQENPEPSDELAEALGASRDILLQLLRFDQNITEFSGKGKLKVGSIDSEEFSYSDIRCTMVYGNTMRVCLSEMDVVQNMYGGMLDVVLVRECGDVHEVRFEPTDGIVPLDANHPPLEVEPFVHQIEGLKPDPGIQGILHNDENALNQCQRECIERFCTILETDHEAYMINHPEIVAMLKILISKMKHDKQDPLRQAAQYFLKPVEEIDKEIRKYLDVPLQGSYVRKDMETFKFDNEPGIVDLALIRKKYETLLATKSSSSKTPTLTKSSSFLTYITSASTPKTPEPIPTPEPTISEIFYQVVANTLNKATFLHVSENALYYDTAYVELMKIVEEAMEIPVIEIKADIATLYNDAYTVFENIIIVKETAIAEAIWEKRMRKKLKRLLRRQMNFRGYQTPPAPKSEPSSHPSYVLPQFQPCKCAEPITYNRYPKDRFGIYLPSNINYDDTSITVNPMTVSDPKAEDGEKRNST